ncbi:hypothetical protein MTR67_031261 [Solanum verrucosum]|uniref:Uncharacterized protein n=1 Tax=Solanum verrucosum TaxID=315347 RepID=A0AAF0ZDG2_SOLVR|nr:hypothetical protein MTR67_031261 [Solanum verrucosum]
MSYKDVLWILQLLSIICLDFCGKCSTLFTVIKLDADYNTTEIYLLLPTSSAFFKVSPIVFKSKLLSVLHLKLCEINENDIKELPCLKENRFDQVCISPTIFSKLISMCPSIIDLTFIDCTSLISVSVPDMNQLKKVHVGCAYVNKIEIKARNLLEFHLFNSPAELEIDLCACTKIQVLNLNCEEVCSVFPCLTSLSLHLCKGLNKIKIMSSVLESLSLINLDDAFIATPNLGLFNLFDSFKFPNSCALVCSKLMVVEIGLKNVRATNRFLEMFPLGTETTESKVCTFI